MSAADANRLDVEALGKEMIAAARGALTSRIPEVRAVTEMEIRRLAGSLADIGAKLAEGKITPKRAETLVHIHQRAVRSVLRSVAGLTLLTAEETLEAMTRVAAAILNRILGIKLL